MYVGQRFKIVGHRCHAGRGQGDDACIGINLKPAVGITADDAVGHRFTFRIGGRNSANHGAVAAVLVVAEAVTIAHRNDRIILGHHLDTDRGGVDIAIGIPGYIIEADVAVEVLARHKADAAIGGNLYGTVGHRDALHTTGQHHAIDGLNCQPAIQRLVIGQQSQAHRAILVDLIVVVQRLN